MHCDELSNDELNKIAATEIMGWTFEVGPPLHKTYDVEWWRTEPKTGEDMAERGARFPANDWWPCTDRNQSRRVVEAAAEKHKEAGRGVWWIDSELLALIGNHDQPSPIWRIATPRQEVIAAILAVRALQTPGDKP